MTSREERTLVVRAQELLARGEAAVDPLPTADQLSARDVDERHAYLESRRVELYAIASIVADRTVQRAHRDRSLYPPYGLVRSMFSQLRMVVASPVAFELGSIDSFAALGRAYLDTVVFHLDRELSEIRASDQAWLADRLARLVDLFRVDAGATGRARMKDGFSFIYGGLHFGISICVQMVEVSSRVLDQGLGAPAAGKAKVIRRSLHAPYRLAGLNIDDVPMAYQQLMAPGDGPAGWMRADHFVARAPHGQPSSVDLSSDRLRAAIAANPNRTYATYGCPARVSPSGGQSAIALLWSWCIELAEANGLLGSGRAGAAG